MKRTAVYRLLDTRRRVEAIAWRRRAEVIRQQLVAQRQTVPA